jgi:predicted DNA binding CopG/RHH family protein
MKNRDIFNIKLDKEEQELSDALDKAIEQGELRSVPDLSEQMAQAKIAATNTLRKEERITLRISSGDLDRLKQKAAYKGLPYQTFIASVLHEYACGHFVEV